MLTFGNQTDNGFLVYRYFEMTESILELHFNRRLHLEFSCRRFITKVSRNSGRCVCDKKAVTDTFCLPFRIC